MTLLRSNGYGAACHSPSALWGGTAPTELRCVRQGALQRVLLGHVPLRHPALAREWRIREAQACS